MCVGEHVRALIFSKGAKTAAKEMQREKLLIK